MGSQQGTNGLQQQELCLRGALRDESCLQVGRQHNQRWLRQTSLPPKQTSLQLSGLVYEYKGDPDSIMQTSLPQETSPQTMWKPPMQTSLCICKPVCAFTN